MLDAFTHVLVKKASNKKAEDELTRAMSSLPLKDLQKIASVGIKEAFDDSEQDWLKKYEETPLYDKAILLQEELLKIEGTRIAKRLDRPEPAEDLYAQEDMIRLKKRQLDLELSHVRHAADISDEDESDAEAEEAEDEAEAVDEKTAHARFVAYLTKDAATKTAVEISDEEHKKLQDYMKQEDTKKQLRGTTAAATDAYRKHRSVHGAIKGGLVGAGVGGLTGAGLSALTGAEGHGLVRNLMIPGAVAGGIAGDAWNRRAALGKAQEAAADAYGSHVAAGLKTAEAIFDRAGRALARTSAEDNEDVLKIATSWAKTAVAAIPAPQQPTTQASPPQPQPEKQQAVRPAPTQQPTLGDKMRGALVGAGKESLFQGGVGAAGGALGGAIVGEGVGAIPGAIIGGTGGLIGGGITGAVNGWGDPASHVALTNQSVPPQATAAVQQPQAQR